MPNLGQPVLTMSGPLLQLGGPGRGTGMGGRLLYRDGFEAQIRKLASAPGVTGVWLPGEAAAQLRAHPGDRVTLSLTGRSAPVRVAGVYQELHRLPPTAYWCAQAEEIYPPGYAEDPPPPLVLADRATFTAVSRRLQEPRLEFFWDLELARGLTLAEARQSAAAVPTASEATAAEGELTWAVPAAGGWPGWSELATVPQALGLLDDLTVRENVALPVRLRLGPRRAAEGRTEELLGLFGLAELADRSPSETSLGQRQRAAVARALVLTPQLVLADEPSAHQDAAWVHDVFAALRQVVHDRGAACLVATHDPDALAFADRVLHLADSELRERAP